MDSQRMGLLAGAMLLAWGGWSWALEIDGESRIDLDRFKGLMDLTPVKDAHELSLAIAGAPALEVHLRVGKVSKTECHYIETLRDRRSPSNVIRVWRSASALPCARVAEDLAQNLTSYRSAGPALVRTSTSVAGAARKVALTPGSRIRSEPSLSGRILRITQGKQEVTIGSATGGSWYPVLESGRTVGFVHEAVIEPLRAG